MRNDSKYTVRVVSIGVLAALVLDPFAMAQLSGAALAQSTGSFTATGNMTAPRAAHTAALLPNGKVLIAGGANIVLGSGEMVWGSAELYDPTTGTFTATGNMIASRWLHTATLLPNGKVLITGGSAGGFDVLRGLASAELYDPSSGTFTLTGSMTTARMWHSATLLPDGRVLIAGGLERNSGLFKVSSELYDPSTGAFTAAGDMNTARFAHTATMLSDGKVLLDGTHNDGPLVDRADLYDPESNTFNLTGTTSLAVYPMAADTATLLMNGKVLVTRTGDGGAFALQYDPSAGTYAPIGKVGDNNPNQQTATLLPDGTILIAGGDYLGEALLYDPAAGKFSPAGNMTIYRRWHTATLLPDGAVLIAGGYDTPPVSLISAQLYTPPVLTPSPVLFSLPGDGKGPGAILHSGTHQVVSPDNPAVAGEALEVYLTGLTDGSVIPPQVAIGGRIAELLFYGNAPGFAGLNQVNVRMPSGVQPGPAVSVRLTYINRPSNAVTIGVQ